MPRGMYPNRYKNKQEKTISKKTFRGFLEKAKQYRERRKEEFGRDPRFKDINVAGFLTVCFYSGLRVTEIVGDPPHKYKLADGTVCTSEQIEGIIKENIRVEHNFIRLQADEVRKHGERFNPLWLPLNALGADEIIQTWKNTKSGERLFPISRSYAWQFIKDITGDYYPHFFRLNRATRFAEHPDTSLKDLQNWFGWKSIVTASKYMAKGGRQTKKMAERF